MDWHFGQIWFCSVDKLSYASFIVMLWDVQSFLVISMDMCLTFSLSGSCIFRGCKWGDLFRHFSDYSETVLIPDWEWVLLSGIAFGNYSFKTGRSHLCLVWFLKQLHGFSVSIPSAICLSDLGEKYYVARSSRLWHFQLFRGKTDWEMQIVWNKQKGGNKDYYSAIFRALQWMNYRLWWFILSCTKMTAVF